MSVLLSNLAVRGLYEWISMRCPRSNSAPESWPLLEALGDNTNGTFPARGSAIVHDYERHRTQAQG